VNLEEEFSDLSSIYVIDRNVYKLFFYNLDFRRLILVDSIEENKTINYAMKILEELLLLSCNKSDTLIGVGGGILQDLVGFVANVYFRGIDYIFIPTTLLAMSDSCIGSKTSLNFKTYKNIIGTFYPPAKVFVDVNFLSTLSFIDLKSGMGEIFKLHLIGLGLGYVKYSTFSSNTFVGDDVDLEILIRNSLQIKKSYIEIDEFDNDIRNELNFGHLFGHALETYFEYKLPHGVCVIFGIVASLYISSIDNKISKDTFQDILNVADEILGSTALPNQIFFERLLPLLKKDKKQRDTLLSDYEMNENFELIYSELTIESLKSAVSFLNQKYQKELFSL
jgi:3-dehydroquinate synthase